MVDNTATLARSIKAKAVAYLARREHTRQELVTKLTLKYPEAQDLIQKILDQLQQSGYLSEERYIKSYLNSKSTKAGLAKIKYALRQKIGDSELIDEILRENPIDECAAARALLEKKFGMLNPNSSSGKHLSDKQQLAKQIRFLQNKGYNFSIIKQICDRSC